LTGDVAQRLDAGREQQRLGHGREAGLVALLHRLPPERREVRRDRHAEQQLGLLLLELRDLRAEVLGAVRVVAGVDDRVPARLDERREAGLRLPHARPSGSLGHRAPATLLLGTLPHMSEKTAATSSRPQKKL
jgi:hypothetical protein